jgi:serine/threonine-protein kinase
VTRGERQRFRCFDRRTDIWAFGCVLYEALTGQRAFPGETISDQIAAVIAKEPDWNALPREVYASVRRLLRRCLEKDLRKRLCDIGDARIELEEALAEPAEAEQDRPERPRRALLAAGCLGIGAAAAWLAFTVLRPAAPAPPVARFAINLAPNEIIAPLGASVRLAPDGRRLAWVGNHQNGRTQIYYRQLDQLDAKAVEGTAGGASPLLSPDGRWISFLHPPSRTLKECRWPEAPRKRFVRLKAPTQVCGGPATICSSRVDIPAS